MQMVMKTLINSCGLWYQCSSFYACLFVTYVSDRHQSHHHIIMLIIFIYNVAS